TAAGALFGAFAMLMPQMRPLFLILALVIGVSRVVVGAHYPSDVAAGLLLGLWAAVLIAFLFARQSRLFALAASGWPALKGTAQGRENKQKTGAETAPEVGE
ncbi:MAG TPA: phosphatase PAP2 family protein, partial [Sinorhizobium sp.]|nr:phosphatase PAP2 family protein [Sinorhizobium sp.]